VLHDSGADTSGSVRASSRQVRARGRMLIGSTVVAAVAYIDPGNFATNTVAGSAFGYELVWVLVAANIAAMLVQFLAAKLGLVSGAGLSEWCRRRYRASVSRPLWVQAELVCIATDVAEVIGGALALYLLFGLSPFVGGLITVVVSLVILALAPNRRRSFESVVAALFAVVLLAFVFQVAIVGINAEEMLAGLVPRLADSNALVIAAGIIGATVMPHVIYLHSALTAESSVEARSEIDRWSMVRAQRWNIVIALGIAGVVNLLILVVAAQTFFDVTGEVSSITETHELLLQLAGPLAAGAFAIALLASGIASSSVGTFAGEVVMVGFLGISIPRIVRRLITVTPALIVLGLGVDPTLALLWSQVILSFGIPFAVLPLLWFTSRREIMGRFVNARVTTAVGVVVGGLVILVNVMIVRDAIVLFG
jgi:manganese transport protein